MSATPDVESLLRTLETAVRRDHRRRRRARRLTILAAATAVCTAGVAMASSFDDWWTGAEPPANPNEVARVADENTIDVLAPDAKRSATVARTPHATLVAIATKGGGYCLIPSLRGRTGIGNSCTSAPESALFTYATPPGAQGEPMWIAYGRIVDPAAATLDLSAVGVAAPIQLERGGFFLVEFPQVEWEALADRNGPIAIRDSDGHLVRGGCVWLGPAPGTQGAGNHSGMLGDDPGSCDRHAPVPLVIHVQSAKKLVELTLSGRQGIYRPGDRIALWRAPASRGWTCFFLARTDTHPTQLRGGNPANAATCGPPSPSWWSTAPIQVSAGGALAGDRYTILVTGRVKPGSGIVRVVLEPSSGRSVETAFGGDAFLAELPDAPRAARGPGQVPGGPYTAVGYDAQGTKIGSVRVPGTE